MTPEAEDQRQGRASTERAEELMDRIGQRVGYIASLADLRVRKMAALAREEAEDIWAEAQSIHREREP